MRARPMPAPGWTISTASSSDSCQVVSNNVFKITAEGTITEIIDSTGGRRPL